MGLSLFFKVVVVQVAAAAFIIFVLKRVLEKNLTELGIRKLELWPSGDKVESRVVVTVVTNRQLSGAKKERIEKAISRISPQAQAPNYVTDKDIWGGMIIRVGEREFEFSLRSRLNQARLLGRNW